MRIRLIISVFSFLICSQNCVAGEDYKCSVKQAVALEKSGILQETSWTKNFNNQEFVVERNTGRIIGGKGISNHNGENGQPKIIDMGSAEQAYKVLTVYSPYASVAYLEVREFEKGAQKPFLLVTSGEVLSGICSHY